MSQALLIIVSGPPAAGKTTLARRLARELALPLFVRDDIKEHLFDTLGWSDREWSKKLGLASWTILHHLIAEMLQAKQSLVVESNFRNEFDRDRFLALKARYACQTLQVLCQAGERVLLERFTRRAGSPERHPGHVDHLNCDEIADRLRQGQWGALDIGGPVLTVDTSDWETLDCAHLTHTVRNVMAGLQESKSS